MVAKEKLRDASQMGNGQPTIKPIVAALDQQSQGAGLDSSILPTIHRHESTGRNWPSLCENALIA
jgi:hypothetical protein